MTHYLVKENLSLASLSLLQITLPYSGTAKPALPARYPGICQFQTLLRAGYGTEQEATSIPGTALKWF